MYTQKDTHFFLSANAPAGFYSLFDQLVNPYTDDTLYILKGGPGSGKSSFLNTIAEGLSQAGLAVEYIHCSADADSLDAIYIPALKTAYADGTAPHVIEPKYVAVMERYLNTGAFYDADSLKPHKEKIIHLTKTYKSLYARAYDCIAAAGSISRELSSHLVDDGVIAAVKKRARGIIAREIGKKSGKPGREKRRFLSALTAQGYVNRFDTVEALADRVYHLDNNMGLSHYMITDLLEAAIAAGHDCILCPAPLNPNQLEHLCIPALSLAFVSSNYQTQYTGPFYRHIRLDAMAEGERLKSHKAKIRFSKKIFHLLIGEAVTALADAKAVHDQLEGIYNPHMDFPALYRLAQTHLAALLEKAQSA